MQEAEPDAAVFDVQSSKDPRTKHLGVAKKRFVDDDAEEILSGVPLYYCRDTNHATKTLVMTAPRPPRPLDEATPLTPEHRIYAKQK